MVLQQAGEAEEGQAGLLQAELDGLRGPHTGDQLPRGEKQQERPINIWHDSSLIIPVMHLSSSLRPPTQVRTLEHRFSAGRAIHRASGKICRASWEELTHHGGLLGVGPVDGVALAELADGVTEQSFKGLVGVGCVLRRDVHG